MMQVYSALYNDSAHLNKFGKCNVVYHPDDLTNSNSILILHGGEDISPSIYGHSTSKRTHADSSPSSRDEAEIDLAKEAIKKGIPIFGICRGAQLVCALAGGTLVQHVDNHVGGHHSVRTTDDEILSTTTCHHQMMNPWEVDHEMLAWSAPSLGSMYIVEGEQNINMKLEPEVVLFPKIKALAVQGHPEWMQHRDPFVQYCLNLIEEKLL
jgi:gamma-glutamyl-gamma-aminobutyrate hydrolase PuuD